MSYYVGQGFSTGQVASKGSTELNLETGTKRHLRPLDAFSGLLMRPKCTCGLTALPRPTSCWGRTRCLLTKNPFPSWISALWASRVPLPQDKFLATSTTGSMSNQNCYKGFSFKEKVEKHWRRPTRRIRGGTAGPPAWQPAYGVHDDALYKSTFFTFFFLPQRINALLLLCVNGRGLAGEGRKRWSAPGGNQEGAAKMGMIRGHQTSHDCWGQLWYAQNFYRGE